MKSLSNMTQRKFMIILLGFLVEFICWGLFFSFAIFYGFLVTEFDTSFAFMGLVGTSVSIFGTILGPLPGLLVLKTSYGFVIFLVGVLLFGAFFITSYDVYGWEVLFSYSMLLGAANGLSNVTFNYFIDNLDNDFALAVSITTSAAGFGLIFFSCLANYYLISTDGTWRELFRYFAFSGLAVAISSIGFAYYHDPKSYVQHATEHYASVEDENVMRAASNDAVTRSNPNETDSLLPTVAPPKTAAEESVHGWELLFSLTDHRAKLLGLSHAFMFAASNYPLKMSFYYASQVSTDVNLYYYMSVSVGCGIIFSRLVTSFINNYISNNVYTTSGIALTKISEAGAFLVLVVLMSFSEENTTLLGACLGMGFYAFFQAGCITLIPLRTVEVLGQDNHLINVGVQFFVFGFAMAFGSYAAGAVFDATLSFQWLFAFVAVFYPLSILVDDLNFKPASIYFALRGDGDDKAI